MQNLRLMVVSLLAENYDEYNNYWKALVKIANICKTQQHKTQVTPAKPKNMVLYNKNLYLSNGVATWNSFFYASG